MDKLAEQYYKDNIIDIEGIYSDKSWRKFPGVPNGSADKIELVDKVWSDGNFDNEHPNKYNYMNDKFDRLKCRGCGSVEFQVLHTADYETTAKCRCGLYYSVHSG